MLDGAARVDDLVQAAVDDGQPALGITDHGNMYGVLDFYASCRKAGITPVIGTEAYMAASIALRPPGSPGQGRRHGGRHRRRREALLPPHVAGRVERRLPEPAQAVVGRLSRGLLLQAPGRLGAARAAPPGADRHHRVPRRCRPPGPAGRRPHQGRDPRRPPPGHLRPRQPVRRAPGPRPSRAAQDQPGPGRDRPPHRRPPARHQRQPLHPPRGPCGPRRPALRPDRGPHRRSEALQVRGRGALSQVGGRDASPLRRAARGVRQHAADRRAGRRRDRLRAAEPAPLCRPARVPQGHLRGSGPLPTCASSPSVAPRSATAPRSPPA